MVATGEIQQARPQSVILRCVPGWMSTPASTTPLLVPRIETAAELQPAVEAAYFSSDGDVGDRGVGIGRGSR